MHVRPHATLAAALLVAAPAAAGAHDLWLEARGDALVLRHGHRGGESLEVDAGKVRTLLCRREGAAPADVRASASASPGELAVRARCDAGSAYLDGGYWTLTPDGQAAPARRAAPVLHVAAVAVVVESHASLPRGPRPVGARTRAGAPRGPRRFP